MAKITLAIFVGVEVDDDHPVVAEIPDKKLVLSGDQARVISQMVLDVIGALPNGHAQRPGALGD